MSITLYSNDLAKERAKQTVARQSEDRLPVLRNRIARAGERKLAAIAMVAKELGDSTIEREAREKAGLVGVNLSREVEVKPSRRLTQSQEFQALTAAVADAE